MDAYYSSAAFVLGDFVCNDTAICVSLYKKKNDSL